MPDMDIGPSPDPRTAAPSGQIARRLAQQGFPVEEFDPVESGLVAYCRGRRIPIPVVVRAILPTDEEMVKVLSDGKLGPEIAAVDPILGDFLRECLTCLQWLMFEIAPWIALKDLSEESAGRRGVCGAVWGENELAYHCRTCEHDPTCAICVPCFQNGDHNGHDYSIITGSGGGCCDCGDVTAWTREGFCSKHSGAEYIQPLSDRYANSLGSVLDAFLIFWTSKLLAAEAISNDPGFSDDAKPRKIADALTFVVVEMLLVFYECSESLLSFVSKKISTTVGLLHLLVRAESFLFRDVVHKLHELLLKSLAEPVFKYEFAKVFVDYYPCVVNKVVNINNDAVFSDHPLLSTFSVQILTVPTLAPRLVREMNLMEILLGGLGKVLISFTGEDGHLQMCKWKNLEETILRIVHDIQFVLSHDAVLDYVINDRVDILRKWMKCLAFLQGANPQKRQNGFHIEEEDENMILPFILCLRIAKIHDLLVDKALSVFDAARVSGKNHSNTYGWQLDDRDNLRHAKVGRLSQEGSVGSSGINTMASAAKGTEVKFGSVPCSLILSSSIEAIRECLRAVEDWFAADRNLMNVSYPNVNKKGYSDIQALKKTSTKIRKVKHIRRLAGSSEVHGRGYFSPFSGCDVRFYVKNERSARQGTKMVGWNELSGNTSNVEGESVIEFDALHILSLSEWHEIIYDISSQNISLHIPLHRFLSLLLQKALGNCYGESASLNAHSSQSASPLHWDFFGNVLRGCHPYGFSSFLMEHPLRIRVFCAQVHAGMWRRNGDSARMSCEWYQSVYWGGLDLELDLFLLQCCAALAPPDPFVNRIVSCFGLSSYISLNQEHSSMYEAVLVQEMLTLLIHVIKERRFCGLTIAESLKRELVQKLAIGDATRSQLLRFLPRDLSKVGPLQDILDTVAQYSKPSGMNQGMYSLRWSYWKELDLYHPRWKSRDLQFAEERYLRFCSISPLTTQLPKWTQIYDPLKGIARVATCKMVLKIIRSVIYYAVIGDAASCAPDTVILTALHLLSLALDICSLQKHPSELSCYPVDPIPLLAFSSEDIGDGMNARYCDHSLLSLLVSLMRLRKNDDLGDYMEAGHCNLSSFIESLLRRFAQIDSGCLNKLHVLASDVVLQIEPSIPKNGAGTTGSTSDADKRREKARERQAAIMKQMKSQQFKFLASSDDRLKSPASDQCESNPDVCSLCHEPSSESPLSYPVFLQKSRLLSFVDRGALSWEQVDFSSKVQCPITMDQIIDHAAASATFSGCSGTFSASQPSRNVVNEFIGNSQFADTIAVIDAIRTCYPVLEKIFDPYDVEDNADSFETLEEAMYSICRQMHSKKNSIEDEKNFCAVDPGSNGSKEAESVGKIISAISGENPSNSSQNIYRKSSEVTMIHLAYDEFGPFDADGVHLYSCGHALHLGCLEQYLFSLKLRNGRRVSFEGSNIVDPNKGEFLCPVCRRLANSVLPSLPEGSWKAWMHPNVPSISSEKSASFLTSSHEQTYSLRLQNASSLLKSAAHVVRTGDKHSGLSMRRKGRVGPNLKPLFHVLDGMYFGGKQNEMSQHVSGHPVIIWDTLKYSIMSMEIASRSGKTCLIPNYDLSALYEALKSPNGFILSLFLRIVQKMRCENAMHVIQRFRGVQLFAESICGDASTSEFSTFKRGVILQLPKHADMEVAYNDARFWKRASDPVLSHDSFSSLMWVLFCLPSPFLMCKESLLCLVHIFYAVSVTQAIITYFSKHQWKISEFGFHDCLISDICNEMEEVGLAQHYLVSNFVDPSSNVMGIIRSLSFPYLRRCALLWHLVNPSMSAAFFDTAPLFDGSSCNTNATSAASEFTELAKLERMFQIPPLDVTLKDEVMRSLSLTWLQHFHKEFYIHKKPEFHLFLTPVIPFKLMDLPHVYQDLLERFIKQRCPVCEPALCLLCGKLCSACWKSCCRDIECQIHAMACSAGTGIFLLIKKTTILLQRSGRRAHWPSPYLDAFGEEDLKINRGRPLYLMEERYAALTEMVAAHGLDQSSNVLALTNMNGTPV